MTPVRWQYGADVPDYRCPSCAEWWPLTTEFWRPGAGMRRCKACYQEAGRLWAADHRRRNPGMTEGQYRVLRLKANADPVALERLRRSNRERMARWRSTRKAA